MDTYLNRLIIEFLAHGLVHLDEQVTYKYSQLTLDKIGRVIQWNKVVSTTNGARTTGYQKNVEKQINIDTDLTHITKINSKRIIFINVKCKDIKLLEDSTGENLNDLEHGDAQRPKPWKKSLISWTPLKLKTPALWKILSRELEDKPQTGGKNLQRDTW